MLGASPNLRGEHQVHASIARSAAMRMAMEQFEAALRTGSGVLIAGETGTGRELMARAIHRASIDGTRGVNELLRERTRTFFSNDRLFVVVDCGAPDLEHALFGAPGASHAQSVDVDTISHESSLRRALGGTLFLRQLHDMPTRHQVRLARVLRDGEAWVRIAHETPVLTAVHTRVIGSIEPTSSAGPDTRISHDLRKRFPNG